MCPPCAMMDRVNVRESKQDWPQERFHLISVMEEMPRDYRHHPETQRHRSETTFPSSGPVKVWWGSNEALSSALLCLLFGLLCVWWPRKATRSLLSGAETCSRDIKGDLQTQRKKIIAQRLLFSGLWSSQSCVILLKFLRRHIKRHIWDYSWCVVRVQSFKHSSDHSLKNLFRSNWVLIVDCLMSILSILSTVWDIVVQTVVEMHVKWLQIWED